MNRTKNNHFNVNVIIDNVKKTLQSIEKYEQMICRTCHCFLNRHILLNQGKIYNQT